MVFGYIRFSTSSQDAVQQRFALDEYAKQRGLVIDEFVEDEGVSGGVSYTDRNLYRLVQKLTEGDVLVVSELSRLGRAMADISKLLNEELKPRKIRLVIIKSAIDIDCAKMKAQDEFVFSALSFAAQLEKELIQSRTQSAIDARKELIKKDGGFISKAGRYCTKFGPRSANALPGNRASARSKQTAAKSWREKSKLYRFVKRKVKDGWSDDDIVKEARAMYEDDPTFCKMKGGPLDRTTCWIWRQEIVPFI